MLYRKTCESVCKCPCEYMGGRVSAPSANTHRHFMTQAVVVGNQGLLIYKS